MVRLVYSNRTEALLDELASRVRAQQLRDGPLVPVSIVVPSAAIDAEVRLAVARAQGVAANLDVALLTRFAADLFERATGDCLADAKAIEAMALAQLFDAQALAAPEMAPVRAYLRSGSEGGESGDAVDVRGAQLAARIGRLFEEYAYSRGDMLASWRKGLALGDGGGDVEPWQRRMWLAMFGEGGAAERRAPRCVPLCDALDRIRAAPDALPSAVHVFAFSHFARTFRALFESIGRSADVCIYTLSPCEGFWEDADRGDPEPLVLWSRPGREHVRALNAMAGFDHDDAFADPLEGNDASILHRVQSDVLHRHPAPVPRADHAVRDESVVVLEHASARRELEAIASDIWRLCEAHDDATFDDFAVVVPEGDAAEYAALIPGVFREAHHIPFRTVGIPSSDDRVLDAVELLLALPLSRFTRQDVLRVAVHPLVVAAATAATDADEIDPRRWVDLCDSLGIVHGADRSDHEGTYIERDIFNWDQGLRRLALGALMSGDATGDGGSFSLGEHEYVPYEVAGSDATNAAVFGLLARSLIHDARFARRSELTLADWSAFFRRTVEAYVAPTDRAEEERLSACLRRLRDVGAMGSDARPVRYRLACEIARQRLRSAPSAHGGEGVVVSTLTALRPLPFRFVFACGMGEGRFPSPDAEDPLDLRWAHRHEGDVRARERDRYAFLELLLCTRDRLALSYVSRDAVTGDALAPSSAVQELLRVLGRSYGVGIESLRRRHPLRRWNGAYFPDLFPSELSAASADVGTMRLPEARAEARMAALRRSAESAGARVEIDDVHARARDGGEWAKLANELRLASLPAEGPPLEDRIAIPLYALVKFLEFPLQGWARFRLGLDETEDDDAMAREDESFETSPREATPLLRDVLLEAAASTRSFERVYDDAVARRELRGAGPSGVFARGERDAHVATLEAWTREIETSQVSLAGAERHRLGRAGDRAHADRVHAALSIDVDVADARGVERRVRAEISGRLLVRAGDVSLQFFRRLKADAKKAAKKGADRDAWVQAEGDRLSLRALVDHAALSASGIAADRQRESMAVIAMPEGASTVERAIFAPLSRDAATVWLRDVLRDLLSGPHAYFFPCEAAFARAFRAPHDPLGKWLDQARDRLGADDDRSSLRSAYGPVPRSARYPSPDEEAADSMVARRFGLLLGERAP